MDILRNDSKRVLGCLVCFILALWYLTIPVGAEEYKTVRVGWYEDSYNITDANGQRRGYNYEFQRAIASCAGWKYIYVKAGWSDLFQMVQNGDIDVMGGISYTDERAQTMLFSNAPMGRERYYLYANLDGTGISPSKLETLNGKRVAVLRNSVQTTQFLQWEERNHVQLELVYVNSFEEGKQRVRTGDIQCVVSTQTPAWPEFGLSAIAMTGASDIFYAINPKRPDLKTDMDRAMSQLEADNLFYADELYQRYLQSVTTPILYNEEIEWLQKHGPIRIGWLANDHGISTEDPLTGRPTGMINDYIKYAENCMGQGKLSFTPVKFQTVTEELEALKEGKIDMIFRFTRNPYLAEENDISLTNMVMSLNMVAVTGKTSFDETSYVRVAVSKDDLLTKGYISFNYPEWEIVEYGSTKSMEKAVRNGDADCFVAETGRAMAQFKDDQLHSVLLMKPNQMTFAVALKAQVLMSILNKTLKAMPTTLLPNSLSVYYNNVRTITIADFVKNNLLMVSLGVGTVVIVVLLIIANLLRKSKQAEAKAKAAAKHSMDLNRELQESHVALEKALREAEQASEAKTNFLFNMSHDIRTPMNALLGYAKLIKQELTDKKLLGYEEKMEQAGRLLLSIINNVLDMARIESGKMELDESYSHVGDVLENVYTVFAVEAKKKQIDFTHHLEIEHSHILCDVTKIQEILTNLISNAIKYTPAGGKIRISVQEIPCRKEGYATLRTEISDTGIGMSEDYIPHLFEAFTREKNTTLSKVSGTGLGMAIVKKLVDMMGGSLEVKSELGKGSTFTVTLTHRLADKAYYEKQETLETKGEVKEIIQEKHILLAEDNELNAEIATVLLEQMGLIVDHVTDGIQCVSQLEKEPAGTYDLILMDVQMPKMDGYQATRAIRQFADKKKANIPIIAMTANAFEEDKKMAINQGMNDHIAKPIDVAKVEKVLLSLLK